LNSRERPRLGAFLVPSPPQSAPVRGAGVRPRAVIDFPAELNAEQRDTTIMAARDVAERAGADTELFREFLAKGLAAAEGRRAAELERIERPLKLLVSGLRTPPPDGCSQDEYHKLLWAFADRVMKDLGLSPADRQTLLQELPEPRVVRCVAHDLPLDDSPLTTIETTRSRTHKVATATGKPKA
jgi:hypothetical protein